MKLSVLQMHCHDDGNKEANMATFRRLVDEELSKEKEVKTKDEQNDDCVHLLLGPEFCLCGYSYDYDIAWETAEVQGGPTEKFLCDLAKQHNIFVGVSYLEARMIDQEPHFLNTFVLAGPNGSIQGRVSKARPCSVESYFFRAPPDPCHVIECKDYGNLKFGVLICYENMTTEPIQELVEYASKTHLDAVLMPFSGPLVDSSRPEMVKMSGDMYDKACPRNSGLLGCPALYSTKVGSWSSPAPSSFIPESMFAPTTFPGRSTICDATGKILGRLDSTSETVLTVKIDAASPSPSQKEKPIVPHYWGGYVDSSFVLKFTMIFELIGSRSYNSNEQRKEMAQAIINESRA